jgi:hypothetical protein
LRSYGSLPYSGIAATKGLRNGVLLLRSFSFSQTMAFTRGTP